MKNIIKTITKQIFVKNNIKLGRWNVDYNNNSINRKIDLSNEDHCGPCGQYKNIETNETKSKTPKTS
jgi:hypothetical protein